MPTKQEIEKYYFEMFQQNSNILPAGTVVYGDKPDVIVNGPRKLGIELRNFYLEEGHPDSEQRQRTQRDSVVSEAQHLYEQSTGRNIQLTFSFDKLHPIGDVSGLATKLAEFVERIDGCENGQIYRDKYEDIPELDYVGLQTKELQFSSEPEPDFPDGVPDVSLEPEAYNEYRNRRYARAKRDGIYKPLQFIGKWRACQVYSQERMSTEALIDIIKSKDIKAEKYERCDAYWLLVIVDFMDFAQDQEIRIEPFEVVSKHFEKVIVYKTVFHHILEIRPRREINIREGMIPRG